MTRAASDERSPSMVRRRAGMLALLLTATGCVSAERGTLHPSYRAHTRSELRTPADLEALAVGGHGRLRSVKFVISDFGQDTERVHLLDGHFYAMHDEWYWYQLLNGRSVLGERPLQDSPGFTSVREAEAWLRNHGVGSLPLRVTDDRVYSEHFYDRVLAADRNLAVGALVQVPAREGRPHCWAFELEYTDQPNARILAGYFAALSRALPGALARELRWLTRSPDQEALRDQLHAAGSPFARRSLNYAELAVPGEVEIYNPGTAVGRVVWANDQAELLASANARSLVIVDRLPDMLPQAAAFVSTVPQTPLSHLNILARNRGIPSVYIGGLDADAHVMQLARAQAPAVLDVRDGEVRLSALSEGEYARLVGSAALDVPAIEVQRDIDPFEQPYAVTLNGLSAEQLERYRDAIGGKAAGLAVLDAVASQDVPHPLLAITVRAYAEHMQPLEAQLVQMHAERLFRQSRDVRFLVLEGSDAYRARFGAEQAASIGQVVARRGGMLRELVARGGVRSMIETRGLPASAHQALRHALQETFGGLPVSQGLRFRSSATTEDVQGFTAAGLYESHTGFLHADAQLRPRDRARNVERALRRTWSSYWSFEAFEERLSAGLDPLRGRMAVLVHPHFDDARELANGVITFTTLPAGDATLAVMDMNVQLGALSVTNPPPDSQALPEIDRVSLTAAKPEAAPQVQRVRRSTEQPDGAYLLDDAELSQVFARCHAVAKLWLALENARLDPAKRARMTTLDFELKVTRGDWPSVAPEPGPRRMVLKQVRSLEPAAELALVEQLDLPVPRDIARRAVQVQRQKCTREGEQLELLQLLTSAHATPDLGYSVTPFLALVAVQRGSDTFRIEHPDLTQPGVATQVTLGATAAKRYGRPSIDLSDAQCRTQIEARSEAALLRDAAQRGRVIGRVGAAP